MTDHSTLRVTLEDARPDFLDCIEAMMQFYNYELSADYPIEFTVSGRYPISSKAEYWSDPQVRPFIIRAGSEIAGFAVVDDHVVTTGPMYSLGYFFVARRYQGQGVGRLAFEALLQRIPGDWEAFYLAQNASAARFWSKVLPLAPVRNLEVTNQVIDGDEAVLYRFSTAPAE